MPVVTIDGLPISVEPDTLIIQAADRAGIEIPRFCYHPDLRPEGNCRMCLVRVKGFARLTPACTTPVADDMVVTTAHADDEVRRASRGVLEFLLINHPLDCPICDQAGECSLQDFYMHPDYGLHHSDVESREKVRKRKAIDLGSVYLDSERCVMCSRCVRFSNEVTGAGELQFVHRGNHVELVAFQDRALRDPYAGNLADLCPVGALTSRDFRFKRRVWFLHHAPSVCAGCSTGCNVRIDYTERGIERVVPRRNPFVNRSWMCDEGRFSYQTVLQLPRVTTPLTREGEDLHPVSWEQALACARGAFSLPRRGEAAVIGSPMATNEALWGLQEYARNMKDPVALEFRSTSADPDVEARLDELLLHADRAPNSRGAMMLGMGASDGLENIAVRAEQGMIDLALILHYPPVVPAGQPDLDRRVTALARLVRHARFSIVLTNADEDWWHAADVILPVASWSEEEGTYTNFNSTTQHVACGQDPPGEVRPAWRALLDLLASVPAARRYGSAQEIFDRGVAAMPAFDGLRFDTLVSRHATVYPPEGRTSYGQEGFAGR